MKQSTNRRLAAALLAVIGLLAVGLVFLIFRNFALAAENAELKVEIAQMEEAAAKLEKEVKVPAPAALPTVTAATPEPTPEEEPVYIGDLEAVEAGTLVASEEVDWDHLEQYFRSYEISDGLFERIYGDDRSYKTYCTVPREDLRYIKVLHYGFDGQIHVGELMVNYLLEEDMTSIFRALFENQYQIEKMYLIDNYSADDDLSCLDNNTSCFNYRLVTGGSTLSNHATGCAIDINPKNNPYVTFDGYGMPYVFDPESEQYVDRSNPDAAAMHMITHEDLCYQLFAERGYTWGGDWGNPLDYQHFEKIVYTAG